MNILLVYISPGRTTATIAKALSDRFAREGHTVRLLDIGRDDDRPFPAVDSGLFADIELLGIGFPVFHLRIQEPMRLFLRKTLPFVPRRIKTFLYATYGGISSGKALSNGLRLMRSHGLPVVGGFTVKANHFYNPVPYPDEEALRTVDDFCRGLREKEYRPISWGRAKKLFSYQGGKVSVAYWIAGVIGELRKLPIGIDVKKCIRCGRCVRECPVQALSMDEYPVHHKKRCIYCYHCTTLCPVDAVLCPVEKVKDMVRINAGILGWERPVNRILL